MGLREKAIREYEERKKEREEWKKREAQRFAERRAEEFAYIFGVKPDEVLPKTPYECYIKCDGLSFRVCDSAGGAVYEVGIECPLCGKTVFREVSSLANLGEALSNPVKCSECSNNSSESEAQSVEEQIVQKLREILDLLREDEEW